MTSNEKKLLARLAYDLKEFEEEKKENLIKGITLFTDQKDYRQLHVTVVPPENTVFGNTPYHFVMIFPDNYPKSAPKIKLDVLIPRDHIYDWGNGIWICLDILETHCSGPYSGWSTAYTLAGILRQLQSYIFSNEDNANTLKQKDYLNSVKKSIENANKYTCKVCNHGINQSIDQNISKKELKEEKVEKYILKIIPKDIQYNIFKFTDEKTFNNIKQIKEFKEINYDVQAKINKRETICFYSKKGLDTEILGIGVNIECYYDTQDIKEIKTLYGLISYDAFMNEKIQKDVWARSFNNFLPLYINKEHGNKAMKLFEEQVSKIYKKFDPMFVVDICCHVMNTQIVNIMNGDKHASIDALKIYCYFHRILIFFVETYDLKGKINSKIDNTIKNDTMIKKLKLPNIGIFLPLLLVSKYNWSDVSPVILKEIFARNVYWWSKDYNLRDLNIDKKEREIGSFERCKISMKLIMFHVYFLKIVQNNEVLFNEYEKYSGQPSEKFVDEFQKKVFEMQKLSSYDEFFSYVDIESKMNIDKILLLSVKNSNSSGYTNERQFKNIKNIDAMIKNNKNTVQNTNAGNLNQVS